jgi:tetratricopeptide (TPR) repeat protein
MRPPRPPRPPPPSSASAAFARGAELQQTGRFAEALQCFEQILSRAPADPLALWQSGRTLFMLKQIDRAIGRLEQAAAVRSGDAQLRFDLGTAYENAGRHADAEASFRAATALKPDWAKAWSHLGRSQTMLRQLVDAETTLRHALTFSDYRIETLHHLGLLCTALRRHDEAIEYFLEAIRGHPRFFEAWNHLGNALAAQNKLDEALFAYSQSLGIEPKNASAKFNWALTCLRHGTLNREVWLKYEYRWVALQQNPQRNFQQPLWRGDTPIAGQAILLHADQGLGDTIQFVRYAAALAARGATVHIEVQKELKTLLQGVAGATSVLAQDEPLPHFDQHCPLLSAPFAEDTRLETIPAAVPYLAAPAERVDRWRPHFPPQSRLRVGVVWRGNPKHHNDANRSVAFDTFRAIFDTESCEFVCLQVGLNPTESALISAHPQCVNHTDQIRDFCDTAAIVAQLDLVIAVDTSVAHLVGALGKPVWLLVPFSPDWRWMLDRDDSPWYPTMRLFRQRAIGDWSSVVEKIRDELLPVAQDHAARPMPQLQPA